MLRNSKLVSICLLVFISLFVGCKNESISKEKTMVVKPINKMIWWGVMSFEINVQDKIMHLDPFFRIHRRADYIFCSNQFTDHSSISVARAYSIY